MKEAEFERQMNRFYRLLKKERTYLIKDQSADLAELVAQKEAFVPVFEAYDGKITDKMKQLIAVIQQQQEENLLLTQQALSYQEVLMDAVQKSVASANQTTYNQKTAAYQQATTTLVDTEF